MRIGVVAIVGALLLTGAVFATTPLTTQNGGLDFDGMFYAAMAGHPQVKPEAARVSPWAYRVATPTLVSWLPWDTLTSFRIVSFTAATAALVLMFLILRRLGFDEWLSLVGMALYAGVFWAVKFAASSPAYIDSGTQAVLLAIIHLTLAQRYLPLIAVMIVAALQKESLAAFALFPIAALIRSHSGRPGIRPLLLAAALAIAPVATIVIVRSMVTATVSIDTTAEAREQLRLLAAPSYWPVLLHASFSGLGMLLVVALLRPRRWLAFLRARYEWIAYLAIALVSLFGGRDKARLFLPMLPAVLIFSVMALEDLRMLSRGAAGIAWLAALLLIQAYIGNYFTTSSAVDGLAMLVPEHSGGRYVPYLWRNLALAAGLAVTGVAIGRRGN